MSRAEAKSIVDLVSYQDSMKDVYAPYISEGTVDESPDSYRDIKAISNALSDVTVQRVLKPLLSYKRSK